jgi:SWI/SNF-related matrix-associated actin-dependent regulator 1 of chromatin subfamily A
MRTYAATTSNLYKILCMSTALNLTVDDTLNQRLAAVTCDTVLPNFNFVLKQFQAEGVAYLEAHDGRCLLADDMGLGKTVQVMAYAHKCQKFPMLVVCLNSLKFNWRNEICAMTGAQYKINIVGKTYPKKTLARFKARFPNVTYSRDPMPGQDIYISNFNSLHRLVDDLVALKLNYVAIDESQRIKNPKAKRTEALLKLVNGEVMKKENGKKFLKKINNGIFSVTFMTGTPFVNRPSELWTTVNTVGRHLKDFSTWNNFAFKYCGAYNNGYGWVFNGATHEAELHKLLTETIMLRRLKDDVLKELPSKQYKVIALDFDRTEYDIAEAAFDGKVDWKAGIKAMVELGANAPSSKLEIVAAQKLKEMAARAKMPAAVEWIKEYTEDGEKLVVFAHNIDVLNYMYDELVKDSEYTNAVCHIMGGVSDEQRDEAQRRFQTDDTAKVMIVGNTVGGEGWTFTASQAVAVIQLPWTPGELSQMGDRVRRIGQLGDHCTIFILTASDTIEDDHADLVIRKGAMMDAVLDGGRKINQADIKLETKIF